MSDLQMLILGIGLSLFIIFCFIALISYVDYKMDEKKNDKKN